MSVIGVFDVTQHEPLDVEGVIAAGANLYRLQGHCGPCAPSYRAGLLIRGRYLVVFSDDLKTRSPLEGCVKT